jgi:hypothetical protein
MRSEITSGTRLLCAFVISVFLVSAHADGSNGYEDANLGGGLTMGGLRRTPPLGQRGIDKMALLLDTRPVTDFVYVGLTIFQNKRFESDDPALITDAIIAGHFQRFFADKSAIELVDQTASKLKFLPFISFSAWNGEAKFVDDPALTAWLDEMAGQGIDAILLMQELDERDFLGKSGEAIGSKGLYRRGKQVHVFGGFRICVIDIHTRKLMKNTYFAQGATKITDTLPLRKEYSEYTGDERKQLAAELSGIYAFNIERALLALKVDQSEATEIR